MTDSAKLCTSEYLSNLQLLADNTEKKIDELLIVVSNHYDFFNQSLIIVDNFNHLYSHLIKFADDVASSYVMDSESTEFASKNLPQLISQCEVMLFWLNLNYYT